MNFANNFDALTVSLPYMDEILSFCLLILMILSAWVLIGGLDRVNRTKQTGLELPVCFLVFLVFNIYFMSFESGMTMWFGLLFSLVLSIGVFHPGIALSNTVAFLTLRPWELFPLETSFIILPRGVFLVFLISFILNVFRRKALELRFDPPVRYLFLAVVWIYLSTFVSTSPWDAQSNFFETYVRSVAVGLLIVIGARSRSDSFLLKCSIVIGVLGLALVALLNTYVFEIDRLEGRGAIQNSNDLAAILIMVFPLAISLIWKSRVKLISWMLGSVLLVILGAGIWKAQSRAAYLAVVVMILTAVFSRYRDKKKVMIQLVIAGVLAAGILSQVSLGRNSSDLEESQSNRIGYWKAGFAMTIRNPVLGVGYGDFSNRFTQYGVADFTEQGKRTAHSSWILLMSEAGLPALFFMLSFVWLVLKKAWRIAPQHPEYLLALVGYGVCISFLSHIYTIYPYLLSGLIISVPETKAEES